MIAANDPASKLVNDIYLSLYAFMFARVKVAREGSDTSCFFFSACGGGFRLRLWIRQQGS